MTVNVWIQAPATGGGGVEGLCPLTGLRDALKMWSMTNPIKKKRGDFIYSFFNSSKRDKRNQEVEAHKLSIEQNPFYLIFITTNI